MVGENLEQRIRAIEDRLEIYNLIAGHPPSADTGADYYAEAVYTEDGVFDRGADLSGGKPMRAWAGAIATAADALTATSDAAPCGQPPPTEILNLPQRGTRYGAGTMSMTPPTFGGWAPAAGAPLRTRYARRPPPTAPAPRPLCLRPRRPLRPPAVPP